MKSFCIKSNRNEIVHYLLEQLEKLNLDDVFLSCREFRVYENIIIHYKGDNLPLFLSQVCDILSNTILRFYEEKKLKEIINVNYFYFSDFEKKEILQHCIHFLSQKENMEAQIKDEYLYIAILKYLSENKSLILDGFVNFRLADYQKTLDFTVDSCVNEFLIEREYNEFINLLKIYIESRPCETDLIHLIYHNNESILLDEEKNIIPINKNLLNAKYLSDISFSSNDYALNSLLNLLPKKLVIHIIDQEDEFIQTLKLIFDNKVSICNHCSLCTGYRMLETMKK